MTADILCSADPDLDYASLKAPRKKSLLAKAKLPSVLSQLEKLAKQLTVKQGKMPKADDLSSELQLLLLRPKERLKDTDNSVIWQLLLRLNGLDALQLYIIDKNYFFRQYLTWPKSKQDWAIQLIKQNYKPQMNR